MNGGNGTCLLTVLTMKVFYLLLFYFDGVWDTESSAFIFVFPYMVPPSLSFMYSDFLSLSISREAGKYLAFLKNCFSVILFGFYVSCFLLLLELFFCKEFILMLMYSVVLSHIFCPSIGRWDTNQFLYIHFPIFSITF